MSNLFHKYKVLIVDDNPKNIQVVANILDDLNYSMSFAKDGAVAIEMCRDNEYDLILLDVMMSKINGFDVCRILKSNKKTRHIPIIFLTAKADSTSIVEGFEVGAIDYITKPFNSLELKARVQTHLRLKYMEKKIEMDKRYFKSIFDAQDNIMVITDKNNLMDANDSLFKFFGYKYKNVKDFREDCDCICDFFEKMNKKDFVYKNKNNQNWLDYVMEREPKVTKAKIVKDGKEFIFSINVKQLDFDIFNIYVVVLNNITELEMQKEKLEFLATTDPLTKVANRAKLDKYLLNSINALKSNSIKYLSIIFFDIDFFKKINDTHGHKVGDTVLVELANLIKNSLKNNAILARWGGEEFVIVIKSDLENAHKKALELREMVEKFDFTTVKNMTCSFGVSQFREDDSENSFVIRADEALYRAKLNGRNRVEKN